MKKYFIAFIVVLAVFGCMAEKSEKISGNVIKPVMIKSRAFHNDAEKNIKIDKSAERKIKYSSGNNNTERKKINKIVYYGINNKSTISYNIITKKLVYNIKSSRINTLRLSGLAGLIKINGTSHYTSYNEKKVNTAGCIYDTGTKNIVVNAGKICRVEMIIEIDDMPHINDIKTVEYVSDLGNFILEKYTY